jgi:hypothetical protein
MMHAALPKQRMGSRLAVLTLRLRSMPRLSAAAPNSVKSTMAKAFRRRRLSLHNSGVVRAMVARRERRRRDPGYRRDERWKEAANYRIDKNMPPHAFDHVARIIAMRIDTAPALSPAFTLWVSMAAMVGLASQPAASRHFT